MNLTILLLTCRYPIQYNIKLWYQKDARKKYSNYIEKYRGTAIKADHDLLRYLELSNDFLYLSAGNETKFVTVKRNEKNQYVIVDGLHRASIHLYQNNRKIKVCLVN